MQIFGNRKERDYMAVLSRVRRLLGGKREGMEMVQVAILVAIAIILGLIFKSEITAFVNKTLEALNTGF